MTMLAGLVEVVGKKLEERELSALARAFRVTAGVALDAKHVHDAVGQKHLTDEDVLRYKQQVADTLQAFAPGAAAVLRETNHHPENAAADTPQEESTMSHQDPHDHGHQDPHAGAGGGAAPPPTPPGGGGGGNGGGDGDDPPPRRETAEDRDRRARARITLGWLRRWFFPLRNRPEAIDFPTQFAELSLLVDRVLPAMAVAEQNRVLDLVPEFTAEQLTALQPFIRTLNEGREWMQSQAPTQEQVEATRVLREFWSDFADFERELRTHRGEIPVVRHFAAEAEDWFDDLMTIGNRRWLRTSWRSIFGGGDAPPAAAGGNGGGDDQPPTARPVARPEEGQARRWGRLGWAGGVVVLLGSLALILLVIAAIGAVVRGVLRAVSRLMGGTEDNTRRAATVVLGVIGIILVLAVFGPPYLYYLWQVLAHFRQIFYWDDGAANPIYEPLGNALMNRWAFEMNDYGAKHFIMCLLVMIVEMIATTVWGLPDVEEFGDNTRFERITTPGPHPTDFIRVRERATLLRVWFRLGAVGRLRPHLITIRLVVNVVLFLSNLIIFPLLGMGQLWACWLAALAWLGVILINFSIRMGGWFDFPSREAFNQRLMNWLMGSLRPLAVALALFCIFIPRARGSEVLQVTQGMGGVVLDKAEVTVTGERPVTKAGPPPRRVPSSREQLEARRPGYCSSEWNKDDVRCKE
jgi:hypothetical protein